MSFDYCFPWGYGSGGEDKTIPVLVGREDEHSATVCSIVPKKGAAYKKVVQRVAEWMDETGYPRMIIKTDQEGPIKSLQDEVQELRRDKVTIPENSPKNDPASNGAAERAVQEVKAFIGTLALQLEDRIKMKIPPQSPIMSWLVRHVGTILTRLKINEKTRSTPYEGMKGK